MNWESIATDSRRGAPSASAMYRLEMCPASHEASRGMPDEETDVAASGSRIHQALETNSAEDIAALSPDELATYERCYEQADAVRLAWEKHAEGETLRVHETLREIRCGLTILNGVVILDAEATAPIRFSGQADLVSIMGYSGFVLDYKTGRGEVDHAARNSQLRALAVLVARRWRLESVRVAIVQPWAGPPTVADFGAEALAAAWVLLKAQLEAVERATPDDLRAGDWCQYCKAKANCPALARDVRTPAAAMTKLLPEDPKTARAALFARAMEIGPEMLAGHVQSLRLLGWWSSAIEGAAKARAKDDEAFQEFYRLKPGVVREKIIDVQTVFTRAAERGVSPADFSAACSITKSGLEALLRTATGSNGAALKAIMSEVLAGATEAKETAATLEEVKL